MRRAAAISAAAAARSFHNSPASAPTLGRRRAFHQRIAGVTLTLIAAALVFAAGAMAWHANGVSVSAACAGDIWQIAAVIDQSQESPGAVVQSISPATLPGDSAGSFDITVVIGWPNGETQAFETQVAVDGSCTPPPPPAPNPPSGAGPCPDGGPHDAGHDGQPGNDDCARTPAPASTPAAPPEQPPPPPPVSPPIVAPAPTPPPTPAPAAPVVKKPVVHLAPPIVEKIKKPDVKKTAKAELPPTGLSLGLVVALALGMLGSGVALRRRAAR